MSKYKYSYNINYNINIISIISWKNGVHGYTGSVDLILNLVKIMKNTIELGWIWQGLWFQSFPHPFSTAWTCLWSLLQYPFFCRPFLLWTWEKKHCEALTSGEGDLFIWFCYTPNLNLASVSLSFFFPPLFFPSSFFNIKVSPIPASLSHFLFCGVM